MHLFRLDYRMYNIRGFVVFLLLLYCTFGIGTSSTTTIIPSTTTTTTTTTSTTTITGFNRNATTTIPPPVCTPVSLILNISSGLLVGSQTRLVLQCRIEQRLASFNVGEGDIDSDYTIVMVGGFPHFQNNVWPKTFKRGSNFTIYVTIRVNQTSYQPGLQLNINVVDINDPPIIQTHRYSIEEGIIPVLAGNTYQLYVQDPDFGSDNGWGNVTLSSPDLPEQFVIGECLQPCLKIVKPFDADIYKPKLPSNPFRGFREDESPFFNEEFGEDIPLVINFTVIATDGGNLSASAPVFITLRDRNDKPPACSSPGKVYAAPDYKPQPRRLARQSDFSPESNAVVRFSNYCSDADYSVRNGIAPDGYRILGPEDCPGVFTTTFDSLHSDVRYLETDRKSCHVIVVATDPNFATTMSFNVFFGRCPAGYDNEGRFWNATDPGTSAYAPCPDGYFGEVVRYCDSSATFQNPVHRCTLQTLAEIYGKAIRKVPIADIVAELSNETTIPTRLYEGDILQITQIVQVLSTRSDVKLVNYTDIAERRQNQVLFVKGLSNETTIPTRLYEGDILQITQIVQVLSTRSDVELVNYTDIAEDYLTVANTLIEDNNTNTWQSLISSGMFGAETVMKNIETFTQKLLTGNDSDVMEYGRSNFYVKVGRELDCIQGINFPNRNSSNVPGWAKGTQDNIRLGCDNGYSSFSTTLYRNVSGMMQPTLESNGSSFNKSRTLINSPVLSLTLYPESTRTLTSPAVVTFQVFDKTLEKPVCSYWKYGGKPGRGSWATDGCNLESYNKQTGVVVCKCNHLTNFAVLMSPFSGISTADQIALSIISVIGCVISCIGIVITVALHVVFYRAVRSDRTTILLNLCVTLFLAYIIFLVGVNRTESKALCTTISILLHYLYLCVFFIMLAEGVDLAYRAFSRTTKYRLGIYLTIGAYVGSGIIVLISAGASQLQGYGNTQSCWLSVESGLMWAFLVPALIVILVNLVIAVCVLRQLFGLSAVQQKSNLEKAKSGLRGILVILPVTGLAWIFGIFSVSKSTVVFQYLFALLNSTQGLLIFVFHCLLNKKIQDSFKSAKSRFLSQDSDTGFTSKANTKKTDSSQM